MALTPTTIKHCPNCTRSTNRNNVPNRELPEKQREIVPLPVGKAARELCTECKMDSDMDLYLNSKENH